MGIDEYSVDKEVSEMADEMIMETWKEIEQKKIDKIVVVDDYKLVDWWVG